MDLKQTKNISVKILFVYLQQRCSLFALNPEWITATILKGYSGLVINYMSVLFIRERII